MVEISAKDQSGQGWVVLCRGSTSYYKRVDFFFQHLFFLFIPNFISALAMSLRSHQFKDELMVMTLLNMKILTY